MGIVSLLGSAALEGAIAGACKALDAFVRSARSNVDVTFPISIPKIGKFPGFSTNVRIRKTRATISFKVSGLPEQKFPIGDISGACVVVVNAALAVAPI